MEYGEATLEDVEQLSKISKNHTAQKFSCDLESLGYMV